MSTHTKQYDDGIVLKAMALGTALFAFISSMVPMGAGAYMLWQGDILGGTITGASGVATIGGTLATYGTASSIGTIAAIGLGLTGIGGLVLLG